MYTRRLKCRNVVVNKVELAPILECFVDANDRDRFDIVQFLSKLVRLNRYMVYVMSYLDTNPWFMHIYVIEYDNCKKKKEKKKKKKLIFNYENIQWSDPTYPKKWRYL